MKKLFKKVKVTISEQKILKNFTLILKNLLSYFLKISVKICDKTKIKRKKLIQLRGLNKIYMILDIK